MDRRFVRSLAVAWSVVTMAGCWQKDIGRSYYPSGSIRTEATVKNGLLNGAAVMYFENGERMSEAHYKDGMLDGVSLSYYAGGRRKDEATYSEGVLHGKSTAWREDGALLSQVEFQRGRVVLPVTLIGPRKAQQ